MTDKDIGDYLEVPEDQRLDIDPPAAYNADAGFDVEVVPDGEVGALSTAGDEPAKPSVDDILNFDLEDVGDGTPLHFVTADDPAFESEGD